MIGLPTHKAHHKPTTPSPGTLGTITEDITLREIAFEINEKSCVRQAIGQLLEYTFGNGKKNSSNIYVAGEFPVDDDTNTYLNYLREELKIPIYYKLIEK